MTMHVDVYGFDGHELEVQAYSKVHVIFAIVDAKKTRLAWYLFAEYIPKSYQGLFDRAAIGDLKLDRDEKFGDAIFYPTGNSIPGSNIGRLAHRLRGIGAFARLSMKTDYKD